MKKCVEEMDLKNVVFIADKGFYSKSNVENLKNNGLHYIIPLYRNNKLINFKPLQEASFKKIVKNYFSYQNRIVWYYQYEKEGQKLVTFWMKSYV